MDRHKRYFTNDKVVNKRINDFLDKSHMRDKGKFFYKERWFSICSAHQQYDRECNTCNIGSWENVWLYNITDLIYKISPKIYTWLMKFKKNKLENTKEQDDTKKHYRRNQRKN